MLLNYDVIFVEKVPFPVLAYLKWRTFGSTCSTSPIIMKLYQQVRSMKKSKLAKFRYDIISIDRVMVPQIIRHDFKIWLWCISVKNVVIALKLCRLFDLIIANFCANFCEFLYSRLWFTENCHSQEAHALVIVDISHLNSKLTISINFINLIR